MNMDTAAQTLNIQQDLKAAKLSELVFGDSQRTHKLWSNYPTTPFTTTFAKSLTKIVNNQSKLYSIQRVGQKEFQVNFIGDNVSGDNNDETSEQDNEFKQVPKPLY